MERELIDRVLAFVATKAGVSRNKVSLDSRLGSDLGLDGDDALELLEYFGKKFKVSINDIDFEKYFNEENDIWGVQNFINKLFRKNKYIDKKNNEIYVSQLIDSLRTGRLTLN